MNICPLLGAREEGPDVRRQLSVVSVRAALRRLVAGDRHGLAGQFAESARRVHRNPEAGELDQI